MDPRRPRGNNLKAFTGSNNVARPSLAESNAHGFTRGKSLSPRTVEFKPLHLRASVLRAVLPYLAHLHSVIFLHAEAWVARMGARLNKPRAKSDLGLEPGMPSPEDRGLSWNSLRGRPAA